MYYTKQYNLNSEQSEQYPCPCVAHTFSQMALLEKQSKNKHVALHQTKKLLLNKGNH